MYSFRYPSPTVSGLLRGSRVRPVHCITPSLSTRTYSTENPHPMPRRPNTEKLSPIWISDRQLRQLSEGRWPMDLPHEMICINTKFRKQRQTELNIPDLKSQGSIYVNWCDEHKFAYVRWRFNPIHEVVFREFRRDIEYASRPVTILRRSIRDFELSGVSSQVGFLDGDRFVPRVLLVVAFSQPRKYLRKEVRELLYKGIARSVVVVHVDENPLFVNPLRAAHDSHWTLDGHLLGHAQEMMRDTSPNKMASFNGILAREWKDMHLENPDDKHGPILMYGHKWAGEFFADVEIWRKEPMPDAKPTYVRQVIYNGNQSPGANVTLPMTDLSFSAVRMAEDEGEQIRFAWNEWRAALNNVRWTLARQRYLRAVRTLSRKLDRKFTEFKETMRSHGAGEMSFKDSWKLYTQVASGEAKMEDVARLLHEIREPNVKIEHARDEFEHKGEEEKEFGAGLHEESPESKLEDRPDEKTDAAHSGQS